MVNSLTSHSLLHIVKDKIHQLIIALESTDDWTHYQSIIPESQMFFDTYFPCLH
jgi:hypothetical protein